MFADLGHFNMRAIQVIEHFSQSPQLSFSECMHTHKLLTLWRKYIPTSCACEETPFECGKNSFKRGKSIFIL
jgi:hypothetical protein